jgi:hypothetical protein
LDPERWRAVRRYLNAHRPELARAALALYPGIPRVEGTALLTDPSWMPPEPVDVAAVALTWTPDPPPPAVTGALSAYADAVAALERPGLFEDRSTYRLLAARWSSTPPVLAFGPGRYFDVIDVCEAAAHEFAAAHLAGRPAVDALPLRARIGDPLDLGRRPVLPAISALTLRRDPARGAASFVLHWRDPARVASGGGMYQVMPVGMFQPAGESPEDLANDLDLWRSVVRELSEEFLGAPEHRSAPGVPIDYQAWPFFRALEGGRARGAVRPWCLGIGVDPLTLAADILMAVVIDADVFDALIGPLAAANDEGRIADAVPFEGRSVEEATGSRPIQPAGAAVLRLAWRHRERILTGEGPSPNLLP